MEKNEEMRDGGVKVCERWQGNRYYRPERCMAQLWRKQVNFLPPILAEREREKIRASTHPSRHTALKGLPTSSLNSV